MGWKCGNCDSYNDDGAFECFVCGAHKPCEPDDIEVDDARGDELSSGSPDPGIGDSTRRFAAPSISGAFSKVLDMAIGLGAEMCFVVTLSFSSVFLVLILISAILNNEIDAIWKGFRVLAEYICERLRHFDEISSIQEVWLAALGSIRGAASNASGLWSAISSGFVELGAIARVFASEVGSSVALLFETLRIVGKSVADRF